jgi:hypothetical protein
MSNKLTEAMAPIPTSETEHLVFDESTGDVFFTNTAGNITKANVRDGAGSQSLVLTVGDGLNGLAVDWNDNLIYYTNKDRRTINVVSKDGAQNGVVLTLGEKSEPADIVLDLESKMMFWVDTYYSYSENRYPRIEGAPMTGMRPVGTTPIKSFGLATDAINGLTLSPRSRRLFWTYTYTFGVFLKAEIESCEQDGSDCKSHFEESTSKAYPYGIGVFTYQLKDYIYAGDRSSALSGSLIRIPVSSDDGGAYTLLKMPFPNLSQPNRLAVKGAQQAMGIYL